MIDHLLEYKRTDNENIVKKKKNNIIFSFKLDIPD